MVWFSQCIPRHAFILWVALLRRLNTQDRLMKWKPSNVMLCPFCNNVPDSHNHLFFRCDFPKRIWERIQEKMNIDKLPTIWDDVVEALNQHVWNNSIWSVVRRLCLGAIVYFIWVERNSKNIQK